MHLNKHPIAWVLLAALAGGALAQNEKSDWPEGSAMHTGMGHAQRLEHAMQSLETKQAGLMAAVRGDGSYSDRRLQLALESQHQAWMAYRSAECELVGALSGAGGAWPSTYATQCEANLSERRLRTVTAAARCVRKLPAANRALDQNRCLYQLGPLALAR